MKLGFAKAVTEYGDSWLHAFCGKVDPRTWLAMKERGGEVGDSMRMELCETSNSKLYPHLFQVERPLYLCGCEGLCANHPACPGVVYDPAFKYTLPESGAYRAAWDEK